MLGVAVVIVAWASMRPTRGVLLPVADHGRLRLALWLDGRGTRVGALAGVLRNHNGALEAAFLAGLALCSGAGFILLLAAVAFDPQIALPDAAVGQFVQGLRTDWANAAMIGFTMLGDMAVVLPTVLLLIAVLAVYRESALAGTVAAAALAGAAFVPLFKALMHRARPIPMYRGTDGFSFPSGHSTFATIIFGLLALLVAQALPMRARRWVYGGFAGLIALIALSRVYRLAHWPSDVLAGILFGGMVVFDVALVLRARVVQVPGSVFAALVAVAGLGIMPVHVSMDGLVRF
jgi:undecaprenyl-diphosphatase